VSTEFTEIMLESYRPSSDSSRAAICRWKMLTLEFNIPVGKRPLFPIHGRNRYAGSTSLCVLTACGVCDSQTLSVKTNLQVLSAIPRFISPSTAVFSLRSQIYRSRLFTAPQLGYRRAPIARCCLAHSPAGLTHTISQ